MTVIYISLVGHVEGSATHHPAIGVGGHQGGECPMAAATRCVIGDGMGVAGVMGCGTLYPPYGVPES